MTGETVTANGIATTARAPSVATPPLDSALLMLENPGMDASISRGRRSGSEWAWQTVKRSDGRTVPRDAAGRAFTRPACTMRWPRRRAVRVPGE